MDGPVKCTDAPADPSMLVKLIIRAKNKKVKVAASLRLNKLAANILLEHPIGCLANQAAVVVLRREAEGVREVGCFKGEKLEWRAWEAGLTNMDIIHVTTPLPSSWHLSEDANSQVAHSDCGSSDSDCKCWTGQVFYYNEHTNERSYQRPQSTGAPASGTTPHLGSSTYGH